LQPFAYLRPDTLDGVLAILTEHGAAARLLAGGTDLIVRMRLGHIRPAVVIDAKRVRDLSSEILQTDAGLRIGAGVTMTMLVEDPRVRRHFPALVDAAAVVGSIQIRNRATLAGNICNASPAADTVPALLVYGAVANVVGSSGSRRVPLTDFFTGPGRTVLSRGELVQSIDLPFPLVPTGAAFGRITRRRGVDLATINLCGLVTGTGESRFAFGAVGPTPFLSVDTSGVLGDRVVDDESRAAALHALIAPARPITDVRGGRDYRVAMLDVMTRRTWTRAIDRLRNEANGGQRA
jgi:CO/xanthine dehydrogenase FAD-binding subunit